MIKIKIDKNENIENILKDNKFYDRKLIGKYCEEK